MKLLSFFRTDLLHFHLHPSCTVGSAAQTDGTGLPNSGTSADLAGMQKMKHAFARSQEEQLDTANYLCGKNVPGRNHKTSIPTIQKSQSGASGNRVATPQSLALPRTERGFRKCENTVVQFVEARFRKISTRSNYLCGQMWGFLEQIFIPRSRKRPAATE